MTTVNVFENYIEFFNGTKFSLKKGKLHKVGGPAVECANGDKFWFKKGKLNRLDGPAVEFGNGVDKAWFIEGEEYSKENFDKAIEQMKFWYHEGGLHRENNAVKLAK